MRKSPLKLSLAIGTALIMVLTGVGLDAARAAVTMHFTITENTTAPNSEDTDVSYITYVEKTLFNIDGRQSTAYNPAGLCNSPRDGKCQEVAWSAVSILPGCEAIKEPYCISGIMRDGKPLTFVDYTGPKVFDSDIENNLATGHSISIWKTDDGQLIAAVVKMFTGGGYYITTHPTFQSMSASLYSVQIGTKPYELQQPYLQTFQDGSRKFVFPKSVIRNVCLTSYKGMCLEKKELDASSYSLKLRMLDTFPTWITGRLTNSTITSTLLGGVSHEINIQGEGSLVPQVGVYIPVEEWNRTLGTTFNPGDYTGVIEAAYDNETGRSMYQRIDRVLPLETSALPRIWRVSSQFGSAIGACFASQKDIAGYMMTNAMVHNSLNPTILNGEMNYLIASPHTDQNGNEIIGHYELRLRSDVARCLYKLPNTKVTATISVLDDQGIKKVATTTAGEAGGWFNVSAHNFTFSSPTIKVKFTAEPQTITCVKGSLKKKVTALKPLCPKGYKKTA